MENTQNSHQNNYHDKIDFLKNTNERLRKIIIISIVNSN